MSDTTSIVAIWNPNSGSASSKEELVSAFGRPVEVAETTADDPGPGQTATAVDAGAGVVVACGGDGTVRACLDGLSGAETALGIVPLGTGNLLAANLGLPAGLEAAGGVGDGERRKIDLGRINGEAFAVMAGSGFDAEMIADANDELKSRIGTAAYVLSAAKHLRSRLVRTTIEIDGETWFTGRSSMVLVGNFGRISGGIEVFPGAQPDDGMLDVAVMSASNVREWTSIGWRMLRRRPLRFDLARRSRGSRITVSHDEPRMYELDGEERPPTRRLEIHVEPLAITIHQRTE